MERETVGVVGAREDNVVRKTTYHIFLLYAEFRNICTHEFI